MRQDVGGDAFAGIRDRYDCKAFVLPERERDTPAGRGELQSIRDQIVDDLTETQRIDGDHDVRGEIRRNLHRLRVRLALERLDRLLDGEVKLTRSSLEHDVATDDARDV